MATRPPVLRGRDKGPGGPLSRGGRQGGNNNDNNRRRFDANHRTDRSSGAARDERTGQSSARPATRESDPRSFSPRSRKWVEELTPILEIYDYAPTAIRALVKACHYDSEKIQNRVNDVLESKQGHEQGQWTCVAEKSGPAAPTANVVTAAPKRRSRGGRGADNRVDQRKGRRNSAETGAGGEAVDGSARPDQSAAARQRPPSQIRNRAKSNKSALRPTTDDDSTAAAVSNEEEKRSGFRDKSSGARDARSLAVAPLLRPLCPAGPSNFQAAALAQNRDVSPGRPLTWAEKLRLSLQVSSARRSEKEEEEHSADEAVSCPRKGSVSSAPAHSWDTEGQIAPPPPPPEPASPRSSLQAHRQESVSHQSSEPKEQPRQSSPHPATQLPESAPPYEDMPPSVPAMPATPLAVTAGNVPVILPGGVLPGAMPFVFGRQPLVMPIEKPPGQLPGGSPATDASGIVILPGNRDAARLPCFPFGQQQQQFARTADTAFIEESPYAESSPSFPSAAAPARGRAVSESEDAKPMQQQFSQIYNPQQQLSGQQYNMHQQMTGVGSGQQPAAQLRGASPFQPGSEQYNFYSHQFHQATPSSSAAALGSAVYATNQPGAQPSAAGRPTVPSHLPYVMPHYYPPYPTAPPSSQRAAQPAFHGAGASQTLLQHQATAYQHFGVPASVSFEEYAHQQLASQGGGYDSSQYGAQQSHWGRQQQVNYPSFPVAASNAGSAQTMVNLSSQQFHQGTTPTVAGFTSTQTGTMSRAGSAASNGVRSQLPTAGVTGNAAASQATNQRSAQRSAVPHAKAASAMQTTTPVAVGQPGAVSWELAAGTPYTYLLQQSVGLSPQTD